MLSTSIEFLKGVGPKKAQLLRDELGISTLDELLHFYPFRYIDKTVLHQINEIHPDQNAVQFKGKIISLREEGAPRKKRLHAIVSDGTGQIDLIWFKGVRFLKTHLQKDIEYLFYGKPNLFKSRLNIAHPEMEVLNPSSLKKAQSLSPVYSSTEVLNKKGLDSRGIRKLTSTLLEKLRNHRFNNILSSEITERWKLIPRNDALRFIHFPPDQLRCQQAINTLKFEELFLYQYKLLYQKVNRNEVSKGLVFGQVGDLFHQFYNENLPFELTTAQKRVIKEIRSDLGSGRHMNRLLQGDVGSGKTVVALMAILIAIDNGYQACLLAPTEILAQQHYQSLGNYIRGLGIQMAFLSGNVKGNRRKALLKHLEEGNINLLVGTHAILEDPVQFQNLGIAITDEQHRFGVKQRAALWKKGRIVPPHILVMTATPIPRTLAMTVYGDLDISVIDELPPGRKEIETLHWYESKRLLLFGFIRQQIEKGRQIYIVYPMIAESEKMDLANLTEGYEAISRAFSQYGYKIGVVHGKMRPEDKDFEMERFAKNQTQILVATTVIEVGVNVPNASVMVIENTERFGLSQLHQLRGRVGRGAEQSFCILMTNYKLSKEAKKRIQIMCETNDGFKIAQADMEIRGPGVIDGTQQSGLSNIRLANLVTDEKILRAARKEALLLLEKDPHLMHAQHQELKKVLSSGKDQIDWKDIS